MYQVRGPAALHHPGEKGRIMLEINYDITALEKLCDESGILVDNVPFPMIIMDADYRLMKANSYFHEIADLVDDKYDFNFKEWKENKLEPVSLPVINDEKHSFRQEFRLMTGARNRTFLLILQEVYDDQNTIAGYFCMFDETTDRKNYEKQLNLIANTDSLTGLYNRRYLYDYLKDYANTLWSFIYLDLDNFKYINDNYGHSKGDEVLIKTAEVIGKSFPDYKAVRLGGDEFAILVDEELDDEFLQTKLDDFSEDIKNIFHDDKMTLSVSIGLARRRGSEIDIDELIHEGDAKMYEMKRKNHDKSQKEKEQKAKTVHSSREKILDTIRVTFMNYENLPVKETPVYAGSLDEICKVLRIACLEVLYFDNVEEEHRGNGKTHIHFKADNIDNSRMIQRRNLTRGYNVAYYRAWQYKDEEDWNEDEIDGIEALLRLLFVFNGRTRLMKLAEKLNYYDTDTGVRNIKYFMDFCGRLIHEHKIGLYVAMFINLKKFSVINKKVGRLTGTVVMKKYVGKIDELLTKDEVICRVGGDNFAILVKKEKCDAIIDVLKGIPIVFNDSTGEKVMVSAAAGVFVIPEVNRIKAPSELMDRTSSALHYAKINGTQDVVFFDDKMLESKRKEMLITGTFPKALEMEEFLVYYQPKISVKDNTLSGAEALARWMHEGRLIPPVEFIPLLEKSMEICELDFYMLEHVCRDIRRWIDMGKRVVRISVNFSRRHLPNMGLVDNILEIVDRYRVPHEYIEIELTETTTDVEFRDLKKVVKALQENGIMTAVDDFGIGYSSLNLIRDIPWNVLKIDKSFLPVEGDAMAEEKKLMFKYVVAMAQSIGLQCIVEGVETDEQMQILKDNSCELAQGYLFDKPLPVYEFEKKLDDYVY